jgi:hypothetical protein
MTLHPRGRCANYQNHFRKTQERRWLLPRPLCRLGWNQALESLCEAPVNEPAGGIVSEAGITDSVSAFPECLRRILTENVIATNGNDRASQQMVQDATTVVAGLSRGRFCRHTVLAADDLFFALGIARHRIGLNRKKGSEVVGSLDVEEKGLVNPVLVKVWRKFVESVGVAHGGEEIEALPRPVEAGRALPFIPTLI